MNKWFTALWIALFIGQSALAEIWVTPSEITPKVKNDILMQKQREDFHDADFESFFDAQLGHPIAPKVLSEFLDSETQAQRSEVNGDFLDALEKYNHLLSGLFEVPNVSGVQKITFSVLIHRAHLADILKLATAEKFWIEAHAFNPTAEMNKSEFAPDLVKRFGALTAAASFELILTVNPWATIYVDGRAAKNTDGTLHLTLESGTHQACALAPGSEWNCKKIEFDGPASYAKIGLDSDTLISGTCEQPGYRGHPLPPHVKLIVDFAHDHCQRVYYDHTWFSVTGQRLESLNLTPSIPTQEMFSVEEPIKKNWFHDLTSSGWFWTGLSAAVVGPLVISAQNQQEPVVVPSQSYH